MRIIVLIAVIFCSFSSHGSKLSKAFDALEIYNYFEAKRLFEKSLKKHPVPASYGLSIIYARKDNPFSNLDSALSKIKFSYEAYPSVKGNWRVKYKNFGIDSVSVVAQRDMISRLFFDRAVVTRSVFGFQDFIEKNVWSADMDSAIYYRDELAFDQAKRSGKSGDYAFFLAAYPESFFNQQAQDDLDLSVYKEQTQDNSFIDYVNFIIINPDNPYRGEAEDKVYEISTGTGSAESYRNFIVEYPSNQNVKQAWKYLYNAKIQEEYTSENILNFKNEFPDYPFQRELLAEYNMADKILYPIRSSGNWGFCDKAGKVLIEPEYELAEWFIEGLAVVRSRDKYGYINKLGGLVIPASYDDALSFEEGYALVELDELWGIIDRNGDFVIPAQFEDLGTFRDGLCYYQEGDLYGYFDSKGNRRLKPQYSEAFDFENGLAVVSKNDNYGIIDQYGTTFIPFKYEDLFLYSEGKYAALIEDYWGVINLKGDTLVDFKYDFIGKPTGSVGLVELDDEFNYMDTAGTILLETWIETYSEYRQMAVFKNGYAKILYDKGFNLTDTLGKKLFRYDQDDVGSYSDLIAVKKDGRWGYMNTRGQKILDFDFTYAYSFTGNSAVVQLSPFYGVIDRKGNYLVEPFQEDLRLLNDTLIIAKSLGKYGLITTSGDTLLNYQYINIEPIDELVVKLVEEGEVFYYNCRSRQFIRRED